MVRATGYTESRLAEIRKNQQKRGTQSVDNSWYQFLVAPTCPPSSSLYVHGGLLSANRDWSDEPSASRQWTIPSQIYDLTDDEDIVELITFNTENTFIGTLLLLSIPDNYSSPSANEWKVRVRSRWVEFESAQEAEIDLLEYLSQDYYEVNQPWPEPYDDGWAFNPDPPASMPLSGLILRNNGTVGDNTFLPIDRVNRGRSYLFMDVRPRWLSA